MFMTQIDDILYSPISRSMDWSYLWADLDHTNQRILKTLLGNLRFKYDNYRNYYPDAGMVDFAAKLTAYVIPRLLASHIVSMQVMAAMRASVARLEYEGGTRLSIKS